MSPAQQFHSFWIAALAAVALCVAPVGSSSSSRHLHLRGEHALQSEAWSLHPSQDVLDKVKHLESTKKVAPAAPIRIRVPSEDDGRARPEPRPEVLAGVPEGAEDKSTEAPSEKKAAEAHSPGFFSGWTVHHVGGTIVFLSFFAFMATIVPNIIKAHGVYEDKVKDNGETFTSYLSYRFANWFTSDPLAPSLVLVFLTLTLIVTGAVLYALLVGGSPSKALWRIFVWSTASPAEGETSGGGRFLGCMVTVCGLIILSLLLGIVSEVFTTKMTEIKSGASRVVEGGHVLILGFTDCTPLLLEELGKARASEDGGVFVVLADTSKDEVEEQVGGDCIDLRGSRVIVRSGQPWSQRDLTKVSAGSAHQVVILANTAVDGEEADARSIRTLVALKTKGWPSRGRIVVQVCCQSNRQMFYDMDDKVEVVVVGSIVARLMAQSAFAPSLARVFGMMLGFDGDEFYSQEWPALAGRTFQEISFMFEAAVPLGIFSKEGKCNLNPDWTYMLQDGDKVIVLAEDNDTYKPLDGPWFNAHQPNARLVSARTVHKSDDGRDPMKVLVLGWNSSIEPLLTALSEMMPMHSSVTFFAGVEIEEREDTLEKIYASRGGKYPNIDVEHVTVEDPGKLTSHVELKVLQHHQYSHHIVLSDYEIEKNAADERSLAALLQLKRIEQEEAGQDEKNPFIPVVEMCEDATEGQLLCCGFDNLVHSNRLVSQTLAAVVEDPSVNQIYSDLMSGEVNCFEFRPYSDFLSHAEPLPEELTFWEAAYNASRVGQIMIVAWTKPGTEGKEFEMNPKDKTTPRPWSQSDRLVIIRRSTCIF